MAAAVSWVLRSLVCRLPRKLHLIDSTMQLGLSYATPIALSVWLLAAIAVLVLSVFLLEYLVRTSIQSRWYAALYVHAANGFYVDALWRSLARH